MLWMNQLYISIVLLSMMFAAVLGLYAWRHRSTSGAPAFAGFMALSGFWSFLALMRLTNADPFWEIVWYNLRYIPLTALPVLSLLFVVERVGRGDWLTLPRLLLLSAVPAITLLVVWQCGVHALKFGAASRWYPVHALYSYAVVGVSIDLLLRNMRRLSRLRRRQTLLIVIGLLLPVVTTLLHTVRVIEFGKHDLTSFALTGSGLCYAWCLFRYQLFDLSPISRSVLMDNLTDPILVLNAQQRILDINAAAERFLGLKRDDALGQRIQQIANDQPALMDYLRLRTETHAEIRAREAGQEIVYDLRLSLLRNPQGRLIGQLVVLSDMTARKRVEEALRDSQRQLEASYRREQERRKLSDTLREAVTIVSGTLEPRRVVGLLLDQLQHVVTYQFASVMLENNGNLTRLIRRSERGDSYRPLTFEAEKYPLNAEALREKRPVVIADVSQDERWKPSSETDGLRSLMNTPLMVQERPIGVLSVGRCDDVAYTDEDATIVFAFASHVAIALENARLAEQTRVTLVDLQDTLERLQRTQKRLVESEKMAALGQLIANIAHEINTPIAAIRASAGNIANALEDALQALSSELRGLPPERHDLFWKLVYRACQPKPALTTREERQFRRVLRQRLEEVGVDDAQTVADMFSQIGVYDDFEPFLPLLRCAAPALFMAVSGLASQRHNSDNIILAVERVSKIVFALKSYAHHESSGEKTRMDISEGLEVVLTLYQNQLKHDIEVVRRYEAVPQVACYPDELNQVWTNLIHNAIWAMRGKGRLEIAVKPTPGPSEEGKPTPCPSEEGKLSTPLLGGAGGGSGILVEITDSGCGIPDEITPRIFEPFFTTKPAGEGSGMGLDICKKIIEKHQGKIEVESQPGRTTFRVWLPQQRE